VVKKNWGKIGALLTWIGILVAVIFGITTLTSLNEAEKFFGITLTLLLGMYVYFSVFFEFETSKQS